VAQQFPELRDVRRDPPRLILAEQFGWWLAVLLAE
jgi:hypothetical protein